MIEILNWFYKNYFHIITEMKNSDHAYDSENLNPYHLEGDIWTHTNMVIYEASKITDDKEVLLAALLHDLGKPKSRTVVEETKRVRFFQHENISSFYAIEILIQYNKDFPKNKIDILTVLKLINWHSDFHDIKVEDGKISKKRYDFLVKKYVDKDFMEKLINLNIADSTGRITTTFDKKDFDEKVKFFRNFMNNDIVERKIVDDEKLKDFVVLTGVPACGKSTWIKNFLDNVENKEDWYIVSFDNQIRETYPELSYDEAFKKAIENNLMDEIEKKMLINMKQAINKDFNIIVDKTNLTKKSRNRMVSKVSPKKYFRTSIVFLVSDKVITLNNEKRYKDENKNIGDKTYDFMIKNFRIPGYDENFDHIEYIL